MLQQVKCDLFKFYENSLDNSSQSPQRKSLIKMLQQISNIMSKIFLS